MTKRVPYSDSPLNVSFDALAEKGKAPVNTIEAVLLEGDRYNMGL
jgi:uncharacterized protein (UPF0297 family)